MEGYVLRPPFHPKQLHEIARRSLQQNRIDLNPAVQWLAGFSATPQLIQAVRTAWGGSQSMLRQWSPRIRDVCLKVKAGETELWLSIDVDGEERTVEQEVPLAPELLKAYLGSWPQPPPPVIRDLALSAPGLSINGTGSLAPTKYLQNRMRGVLDWYRSMGASAEQCGQDGIEYPDPDAFLMEVAADGIGNTFLIKMDSTLCFFNHEEMAINGCRLSMEEFVDGYFRLPDIVFDDKALGLERRRTGVAIPDSRNVAEHPMSRLRDLIPQLTNLACIALAVRCLWRGRPASHLPRMPEQWQVYSDQLDAYMEACREVCTSALPLDARWAEQARSTAARASDRWCEDDLSAFYPMYAADLFAAYVELLLIAATGIHDAAAATRVADKACDEGVDEPDAKWWAAIFSDFRYLASCDLGIAGSIGKPIPEVFFQRPLWPATET